MPFMRHFERIRKPEYLFLDLELYTIVAWSIF